MNQINRYVEGLETQRKRIMDFAANAPRLLEGTPYEVINLTGDSGLDLDYYLYNLGRARAAGLEMLDSFVDPPEIVVALDKLDNAIPLMRPTRNALSHIDDSGRLDRIGWFSSMVEFEDDGRRRTLVDPRYEHHDAAMTFCGELIAYCRGIIRS